MACLRNPPYPFASRLLRGSGHAWDSRCQMEHRWGSRFPVDLPVRLTFSHGIVVLGRLRNLSITGAFVASRLPVPLQTVVHVESASDTRHWPGYSDIAYVIWRGEVRSPRCSATCQPHGFVSTAAPRNSP